jgi:acyl-CoA thioester hydrolase
LNDQPNTPEAVVIRLPIGPSDIDGLGHVNQAQYHHFLGAARRQLLRRPWAGREVLPATFVVAHAEIDYLGEIRLADGFVDVRAAFVAVGTKSVTIDNAVLRLNGDVAARGLAVMVAWDRAGRRSRILNDIERNAYAAGIG